MTDRGGLNFGNVNHGGEHLTVTDLRRFAPAASRNREPILAVFRTRVPADARVLEIASGSGEHSIHLCTALPELDWQPSDPDPSSRRSIAAWIAHSGLANVRAPIDIDVRAHRWGVEEREPFDAIVSINMIHIAPWECALALLDGTARLLREDGVLFLYGPFKRGGAHTAPSNAAFDERLRDENPQWGVRDLDEIVVQAATRGLHFMEAVEMPANNLSVVFRRTPAE
jgi:cyclopropane fatty-acyl-phospholipid synthase-like methyltransferase